MKNKLILIILSTAIIYNESNSDYLWPTNSSNSITTLFGEKRSRRFHAGIDVRTFGKIGDKIFAIESGYISRIKISSDGYGKAIYLKLNDGNTALYAHLDRYNDSIEKIVSKQQTINNNSFIDVYFKKDQYKINKGEIIGYCGDTGSLSGPHLHFEIRDKDGKPINPLKKYYSITDTLKPIAESIALIPLDKNCFINGKQDYEIIDLKPLQYGDETTIYKYFIQDTISAIGNFGIALNTYDKINNSPFKFGIYEIEMLIDNKKKYKINFDDYSFNQDPLIYREIDFNLHNKLSKNFHRLFINHNQKLDFIDGTSNSGLNLDRNFHNLIINISDNANNKIQVQGIIKGDIIKNPSSSFNLNNLTLQFDEKINTIDFTLSTRYKNSREIPITYTAYDSSLFKFEKPEKPYEVLKYYIKNNGLKSHPEYISLFRFDPLEIDGKIELEHLDNNLLIKFVESEFSGYEAQLSIEYKDKTKKIFDMKRLDKNILSSGLLDVEMFLNIDTIHIKYKTNPEIIFTDIINGKVFNKNKKNYFNYKNYSLSSNKNDLYDDIVIWTNMSKIDIPNIYNIIAPSIDIGPNNIPFKNKLSLSYYDNSKGGIFQHKNSNWIFIQTSNIDSLKSDIVTGGTFAILDERIKPLITNVFPNKNSIYKSDDITTVSFNVSDKESGINYNDIDIKLNDKKLYYDYIPYRDLVTAKTNDEIKKGKNHLHITCKDNLGNTKNIQFNFVVE